MRACTPSETSNAALVAKSAGNLRLISLELLDALQMVAFSSAGFLSSITASGKPLTNNTTSGRRVCCPFGHGELIDGQPVVVVGLVEVDHLRLRAGNGTIFAAILHRHAIHQHPVHGAVALHERRRIGARQLAVGVFQRFGGQIGIEAHQRLAQAAFQHHVAVVRVAALGSGHADGDVGPVQDGVAE